MSVAGRPSDCGGPNPKQSGRDGAEDSSIRGHRQGSPKAAPYQTLRLAKLRRARRHLRAQRYASGLLRKLNSPSRVSPTNSRFLARGGNVSIARFAASVRSDKWTSFRRVGLKLTSRHESR